MENQEKWLSVKEVAGRYGVSRDTIIRRIETGDLEALVWPRKSDKRVRDYKMRLISIRELDRFERENTTRRKNKTH
jgi:hypothetical protein